MFDDRIEITSPGGLPDGLSKEEYLPGQIFIFKKSNYCRRVFPFRLN